MLDSLLAYLLAYMPTPMLDYLLGTLLDYMHGLCRILILSGFFLKNSAKIGSEIVHKFCAKTLLIACCELSVSVSLIYLKT